MSNSWEYPILRTPDVGQALDVVTHLFGVADRSDTFLVVRARTGRASGLPRHLDAFGRVNRSGCWSDRAG